MKKTVIFLLSLISLSVACNQQQQDVPDWNPYDYKIEKKQVVKNGAVVSAHPLASMAGVHILKSGGNAVDAAIATQFALAVVYPGAGNLGGGGFLVARLADGKNVAIDYREKAPGAAHRDMYLDSAGNAIEDLSIYGHLAAGVPGTVAGLFASAKYGKLPMEKLIAPAIELAEKGFVITEAEARSLNSLREKFLKYNTMPTAFVKEGEWKAGDTLVQTDLANTLKRISREGMKGFYEGETAKLIVEEMQRGNGIITLEDLKAYEAKEREPVVFDYKGHEVITMSLPSSGGILLPQMLRMTEPYNIGEKGFHSPEAIQVMIEAERRAYADRAEYMGDPDFVKVPVEKLISREYAVSRMKDFTPGKAGKSDNIKAGVVESEETTHLSVYDSEGNAVAVTTTLNGGYGSLVVVGGAGFLLNNEMDDFSVKPGVPNMYGALGAEANAIVPGKRMLSSMTPTIVVKGGKPWIVVGTPGGTTIPTSVFQSLVNIIDFGLSAEDAVNKPKFHHQWYPDNVSVERDFPEDVVKALENMGYVIRKRGSIGRTELILIHDDGSIEAIADKRGDDHASGY
jgi:gamma-glutamyltranspeptidase/glutathione hydrolase